MEILEKRITASQQALFKLDPGSNLIRLYRFHSAAISCSDEFRECYMGDGVSDIEALGAYADDLEAEVVKFLKF